MLARSRHIALRCLFTVLVIGCAAHTQTVTETFATAKLSATEIHDIIAAVEQTAYDTPDSWEKELRVGRVDLGGSPGLIVRGTDLLCGATGNCQMWVLRKINDKWVSLFEEAPIADAFTFGPSVTNEIKDLTVTTNLSADNVERTAYKFDGTLYREQ